MIGRYYFVSVSCNLCNKFGPPIKFDNRYTSGLPADAHYVQTIDTLSEKEAKSDGFITMGQPLNGFARHVCPSCIDEISSFTVDKTKSKKSPKKK
jgi:hypothetical protein